MHIFRCFKCIPSWVPGQPLKIKIMYEQNICMYIYVRTYNTKCIQTLYKNENICRLEYESSSIKKAIYSHCSVFSVKMCRLSYIYIYKKPTVPCNDVLSYTPRVAHSFLNFKRSGVPGTALPLRFWIERLILNVAVPELFPVQGRNMLKPIYDMQV